MTMVRPEFSRRIPLSRIGAGFEQSIEATALECAALARRLGIPAIASLTCRFRLGPPHGGRITGEGELRCELTRVCVVSLEAFETTVGERFSLCFVPEGAWGEGEEIEIDPQAPDEVGYAGDQLDLGEAACEQLALALDPYPRMPGVPPPSAVEAEAPEPRNPFAALANRRGRGDA